MIEDYYNVLNLKPRNGLYKISIRYLRLSRKLLTSQSSENTKALYQLNRAFEVLRKPEVKKYYDILYNEYINNSLDLENKSILKYKDIIQNHELAGNQRAEKLLNDPEFLEETKITQSWILLLFNFIFYLNSPGGGFEFIPLTGIAFIILGIGIVLGKESMLIPYYLAPGILLFVIGSFITLFTFRQFITDRINK
jgi:hypothetical protein